MFKYVAKPNHKRYGISKIADQTFTRKSIAIRVVTIASTNAKIKNAQKNCRALKNTGTHKKLSAS